MHEIKAFSVVPKASPWRPNHVTICLLRHSGESLQNGQLELRRRNWYIARETHKDTVVSVWACQAGFWKSTGTSCQLRSKPHAVFHGVCEIALTEVLATQMGVINLLFFHFLTMSGIIVPIHNLTYSKTFILKPYELSLVLSGEQVIKNYNESGFCTLKERRKRRKLIQFHKMINNTCPDYIPDLLPPLVSTTYPYHRRRPYERIIPSFRTELYRNWLFLLLSCGTTYQ